MIEHFERFGLLINDSVVRTPIAIASMAGIVDADYVLKRASHIGLAFIGGYSIDEPAMRAAREMAAGGRDEFLFDDPIPEIKAQAGKLAKTDVVTGINLRACTPGAFSDAADKLGDTVVYEIDAHCRQQPMVEVGSGEYYLHNPRILAECVKTLKSHDVTVSVKIRAGVGQDDVALARALWRAGADIIHVDLMDFGYQKLRQIRNSCPVMLIANNSINSFDRVKEMFSHGADLVSLGRRSDEHTLSGLDAAITRYADEHGWYNSPKQLCRGGDIRALAFCCMPVKNCPLIPTLAKIGISREQYVELKERSVKGTPLESGQHTCFGSLAWCCKDSSPCMFREMSIEQGHLTGREYMRQKRTLSERILEEVFSETPVDEQG
ncbi:MAG: methanogenesis marker 9 domain-containing protein [Methanoregulaceae archaeon]|nr:methanogenesis marker 9 domain-containing protein [Methanoregulaceae archaeon]